MAEDTVENPTDSEVDEALAVAANEEVGEPTALEALEARVSALEVAAKKAGLSVETGVARYVSKAEKELLLRKNAAVVKFAPTSESEKSAALPIPEGVQPLASDPPAPVVEHEPEPVDQHPVPVEDPSPAV